MKELTILAEINEPFDVKTGFTVFEAGIWRVCLYTAGPILPFMKEVRGEKPISCANVIIDQKEYYQHYSLEDLRNASENKESEGYWYNGGNVIYIRFPFYNPPNLFYSHKYGVLMGFTDGSPLLINGIMYRPGLMTSPRITQSVDAYKYDRMKFNTATVSINNSGGQFDDAVNLFGNEFNLKIGVVPDEDENEQSKHLIRTMDDTGAGKNVTMDKGTDEYITLIRDKEEKEKPYFRTLAQYYIENISVTLGKADFYLSDKRERLSGKIPFEQYTTDEYPNIDDNSLGKDMQEVYGHCYGVPGVCLEGKLIDAREGEPKYIEGRKLYYLFRFSSRITRIDRIQVKMTPGEYKDASANVDDMKHTDGWTTIWQSVKPNDGSVDDWDLEYPAWKKDIHTSANPAGYLETDKDKGMITLRWDIAKQGGIRENRINEVRMDGVFVIPDSYGKEISSPTMATPRHILMDIMRKYSGEPFYDTHFDFDEITRELGILDDFEIGVMFDKAISVFEAIEKLQSASVFGFLFQVHENKYTARVDFPNRDERPNAISHLEILNMHEVEVDWNASLYGTYTKIEYAYNYSEDVYRNVINKDNRQKILDLHRMEKEWRAETLLVKKNDAELKGELLLEDFSEMRPLIKNIKLTGEKWLGLDDKKTPPLRVYDILSIDFNIPGEEIAKYPQHIIRLISEVGEEKVVDIGGKTDEYVIMQNGETEVIGKRCFVGSLRCQIMRSEQDTKTGVTTIDVRVTKKSDVWKEWEKR